MIDNTSASHFESLYPAESRHGEIEKILTLTKEGKSCQIVAVPGVGRSDTLRLLAYNKAVREKHLQDTQKWFHFVLLDFSEMRKRPLFDAIKFIFLGLIDSLRERHLTNEYVLTNTIFKESLGVNDELVLFQGLKQAIDLVCIEKELTICLLFDKFEEYCPTVTTELFTNLRVLRNRAKYRFSVVFSLNRPLEELVEPGILADFSEILSEDIVYIALSDKPILEFRRLYTEKVSEKTISDSRYEHILTLTAGHGQLTRLCLEYLLSRHSGEPEQSSGDSRITKRSWTSQDDDLLSQKTIRRSLYDIWNNLSPEEQTTLEDSIHKPRQNVYLEHVGLLKNGGLTIPLLKELIESNRANPVLNDHILFDANTNEIKKGYIVLSDMLTPLEYRLLSFLLQNAQKIVTREEIIQSVWKDDKTTAGVTDQALDQLIFRLRKKIEDNPNNPVHIETIKGRGFKFTP